MRIGSGALPNFSAASLTRAQRAALLANLSRSDARALLYHWPFWARADQLEPAGDWLVWQLLAGRGFGKTRTGAEWVIERAKQEKGPIALVGQTKADVRDTMIELGDSSILKCSPPWFYPSYEPSKRRLTWPNGQVAMIYSGDEPGQLRGPQHGSAWVDELAKFKYPDDTWSNLEFGLRVGDDPRVVSSTTPRPIKIIKQLVADPDTVVTRGATYANLSNLAPIYRRIIRKYEGTRLGRQELNAEILDDNPNALWRRDWIEDQRVGVFPDLWRVAVGVDPSGGSTGTCGIVVAGQRDGVYFVLDDASVAGSSAEWGLGVVAAYSKQMADVIAGEVNFGGDMVERVIRTVDGGKNVAFKMVRASRGKEVRAEPVSALYQQGRVHHVGAFPELEDQLCEWEPGQPSPDRLDALVWAITELMETDGGTGESHELPPEKVIDLEATRGW